jgi:hypothetical protein
MTEVVNLVQKFGLFGDYWSPRIIGELNDSYLKLVKLKGEFVWHQHEHEDELFLVVRGTLRIQLRDRELVLSEGELAIIPRGIEHRPVTSKPLWRRPRRRAIAQDGAEPIADDEVWVLLIESKTTINTGDVQSERTVTTEQWI